MFGPWQPHPHSIELPVFTQGINPNMHEVVQREKEKIFRYYECNTKHYIFEQKIE